MMQRSQSQRDFINLQEKIPGGVNSPVRAFHSVGGDPLVFQKGEGCFITDSDQNRYIDYCMAWGPLILGHSDPGVVKAIQQAATQGTCFGLATAVEGELAALISHHLPAVEQVRFTCTGTEALMTAVRLARGVTQRLKIVVFSGNYHGHADIFFCPSYLGKSPENPIERGIAPGAIQDLIVLPYNDCKSLEACFAKWGDEIAAIVVEPVAANMGIILPCLQFLHLTRELTKKHGALLVFDEVVTGFRVGLGGAQGLYQQFPDLTCLAKVIGGGLPVAAVGGSKEIMSHLAPLGPVYQGGTYAGNPLCMHAGLAALSQLTPALFAQLESNAKVLKDTLEEELQRYKIPGCVQRVGSMWTLFFGLYQVRNQEEALQADRTLFFKFFHAMLKEGVLIPPAPLEGWFLSRAHTPEVVLQTQKAIRSAFATLTSV